MKGTVSLQLSLMASCISARDWQELAAAGGSVASLVGYGAMVQTCMARVGTIFAN